MKSRTKTVRALVTTVILCQAVVAGLFWVVNGCSGAAASEPASWWNSDWHYRTTVSRTTPWRDDTPRPVELAIDFPLLIQQGNVAGQFDPESVRVVERRKTVRCEKCRWPAGRNSTPARATSRAT